MKLTPRHLLQTVLGASALALMVASAAVRADTVFTPTSDGFVGSVNAASPTRGTPVWAGSKASISGSDMVAGQKLTLMRGTKVLNPEGPIVVDAEGKFSYEIEIDTNAATGLQPILVIGEEPAAATVVDLKISPKLEISGNEKFAVESKHVAPGLYQVAYSEASGALFVASAVGRPPVKASQISKIDPATLEVTASVTPAAAPARPGSDREPGLFAVYGLAIDDTKGTIWVTNTRQNTIAVYNQSDLSLVKQFAPNEVSHSRDVIVDGANKRAYVSSAFTGNIHVYDTETLEALDTITILSAKRGQDFGTMSLDLAAGKLFTVSMTSNEAAIIDLASGEAKVIDLPGARTASGVAYDAQEDLLFVASQQSDNLLILKASTGEILHDVEVGAGALNVTFEPKQRLVFVSNRGSGTIAVLDTKGQIVANFDAGSNPNHLKADGKGNVWAVNKSRGQNDETGDRIWKIAPAQ